MRKLTSIVGNDRGLTLVELLIAIVLFIIPITLGLTLIFFSSNTFDSGTAQAHAQQQARIIDEHLKKELRNAGSLEFGDETYAVPNDGFFKLESKVFYKNNTAVTDSVVTSVRIKVAGALLTYEIKCGEGDQAYTIENQILLNNTTAHINWTNLSGNSIFYYVKATEGGGGSSGGNGGNTLTLNKTNPDQAVVSESFSHTFTATGGEEPYSFAVTGGSLPEGLSLATNGVLTGTPNAVGISPFAIKVMDNKSASDSHEFALTVEAAAPVTATITFDSAGGSAVGDITLPIGSSITTPAAPTRTGYTFTGWNPALPGAMPAGGVSLNAQWTANDYTVTFNAQDGVPSSPGSKQVTFGAPYGDLVTTSRTGYNFSGWFTQASGGAQVTSGTIVSTADNHSLYARWTGNIYTVTFNAQGGSPPNPASKAITFGNSYGTLATASRSGYVFDGWYTQTSGGTKVTSGTTVSNNNNHTLYAQWVTLPLELVSYSGNNVSLTLNFNQTVGLTSFTVSASGKTITNYPPVPGESMTLTFNTLSNGTYLCLTFNNGPKLYINYVNPGQGWKNPSWNHSSCQ